MEQIVAVQRNQAGGIINFETSSGRIISYRKAVMEANEGKLRFPLGGDADLDDQFDQYPSIF
ncbi:DUF3892 domain-containing protein [Rossellomorea marisflavi]|uniref:DUF3892 domain-containing protein n=1 Tax=Rossellomorea marisflavi TaxID=189381 RepID=UPI00064FC288|nr:DUF3892 domain-containing protein [Rossellomorea marisflavi]KML34002.1 hypothetical protein VL12_07035 [Rossellomorea marisflavi]